jgi:hypothetical protein
MPLYQKSMTLRQARVIADGDLMSTKWTVLSDAFDVLNASSKRAHLDRINDFTRAQRLWSLGGDK